MVRVLAMLSSLLALSCGNAFSKNVEPYFIGTIEVDRCDEVTTLTSIDVYKIKIKKKKCVDLETEAEAVILDEDGRVLVKKEELGAGWVSKMETDPEIIAMIPPWHKNEDVWHRPNNIEIIRPPREIDFLVFLSTNCSPSNVSHSFIFYSIKPLKKIAKIDGLISIYQATETGSVLDIVGFYRDRNNNILFDRLTTAGQDFGSSNASQKYSVETFKVSETGIETINLKDFKPGAYYQLF